ncbi:DUF2312 domain-containing protein [Rhodobacter sp. NTK016B]|uniref:DUF2312 domain-containing protein n=1 Tax=Rhodobacter sp. NTK016B TaxID=2759676 RepID=UPI0025706011|nr:DUF2312 domain-containing protein [Rhodobacter sp. NTK016B]
MSQTMKETAEDVAVRERVHQVTGQQIRAYIERAEQLEQEKAAIGDDLKAVFAEAKSQGYDPKILRRLIADRRRNADDVQSEQASLDLYRDALEQAA